MKQFIYVEDDVIQGEEGMVYFLVLVIIFEI